MLGVFGYPGWEAPVVMLARMFHTIVLLILLGLSSAGSLRAERYALLVGVGKYLHIRSLDGPAYDVEAVRTTLLRVGYKISTIKVLLDSEATRPNIVESLRQAVGKLKAGDHLLFYYSGHGTSAFDKSLQWLSPEIGPDSGALATYDLSLSSLTEAIETLVIGRRDLRPILSRVPVDAQALVVLDACYSENSAKSVSVFSGAPIRGINLVDLIQGDPHSGGNVPPGLMGGKAEGGTYPYQNVVSLSAASKDQPALDINLAVMQSKPEWRTVDGKPHGALTNSILEALSGRADTNRDGSVSYDELFRYVRRQMERFPHQPQLLSSRAFSLEQPVLGKQFTGHPASESITLAPARPFRVAIDGKDAAIRTQLNLVKGIEVVDSNFDLLIRQAHNDVYLYDQSGVLVQRIAGGNHAALIARVRAQARLWDLREWTSPDQTFNVRVDAEPEAADSYEKLRTVFRVGEKIRFRISTERAAFLLLVGLDKDGKATVLFPGPSSNDRLRQAANQPIDFIVKATGPAGSEQLKLIGFVNAPDSWDQWSCSTDGCAGFDAGDIRMDKLIQMLRAASGTAETSLRLITQQ